MRKMRMDLLVVMMNKPKNRTRMVRGCSRLHEHTQFAFMRIGSWR